MRRFIFSCLAIITGLAMMTLSASAGPLSAYRWEARPVLVFAPSLGEAQLTRQVDLFRQSSDMIDERDMVILLVAGDTGDPFVRFGPQGLKLLPPSSRPLNRTLRETYSVPIEAFTVILVGKDGGEKKRWSKVVDPRAIFSAIDSMPMRQREMREGK